MSTQDLAKGLVLHLPLDEISETTVRDTSGNKNNGTVKGTSNIVPDDRFGSSLNFDGKTVSVEVPDAESLRISTYSVLVWMKPVAPPADWQGIVGKAKQTGRNFHIWLNPAGYIHHRFQTRSSDNDGIPNTPANSVVWEQWQHIAITNDGATAKTYINGEEKATSSGMVDVKQIVNTTKVIIGRNLDGEEKQYFKGSLAHVRIYDRALSSEQIKAIMIEDQGARAAFKVAHPIDFKLVDDEVQNVLYISDETTPQTFQLELTNSSDQNILINRIGMSNKADSSNYHFALTFTPNTFEKSLPDSDPSVSGENLPESWTASAVEEQTTGRISVYFLYIGATSRKLGASEKLSFTLEYGSAGKAGGARGTTVELQYTEIYYEKDSATSLQGTRIKNVDIVNQRGKKNIPLHVGFSGPNTILNDAGSGEKASGIASTLNICITNILQEDALSFRTSDLDSARNTKFTILFEDLEGEDWDLASPEQLQAINIRSTQISFASGNKIETNLVTEKVGAQGQLPTFEITPKADLGAGEYIDIELTNIYTNKASGFANIYIKYEDVPGYWDGQFVLPVEKTPIVQKHKNVGIGVMPDGSARLMVAGDLKVSGAAQFTGNVGIGTTDPGAKLEVSGELKVTGSGNSSFTGNVGIGTTSPAAPLSISSEAGKEDRPDSAMHITNDCILFGGKNKDREANSAQISAGRHRANSLNIVGMSDGTDYKTRRVDVWAEDGLYVRGPIFVTEKKLPLINFVRFSKIGDNVNHNTGYSADEWNAAISGMAALGGDINEVGATDIIRCYMYVKDKKWHIRADFSTHGGLNEDWTIDVMFVRKEVSQKEGNWDFFS